MSARVGAGAAAAAAAASAGCCWLQWIWWGQGDLAQLFSSRLHSV